MHYLIEITDTFGGEANYSWATRHKVRASTPRGAILRLSRASGLHWRKVYDMGDSIRYDSTSGATCAFVQQWDDEHVPTNFNSDLA